MKRVSTVGIILALVVSTFKILVLSNPDTNPALASQLDFLVFFLILPPLSQAHKEIPLAVKRAFWAFVIVVLLAELVSVSLGATFSYQSLVKLLVSFSVLVILSNSQNLGTRAKAFIRVIFTLILLYGAYLTLGAGDSSALNDSALEVRHTVGYAVFGAALGMVLGLKRRLFRFGAAILGLYISYKLQVMTALIGGGLTVYLLVAFSRKWRTSSVLFVAPLFTIAALSYREGGKLNTLTLSTVKDWGSGRVGAWLDGYSTFLGRDLLPQLFGAGSDTTLGFWGVWWWAQKDIHSDILKILLEYGVFGLTAFLFLLATFWSKIQSRNPTSVAILVGASTTSLISNGLLERPYLSLIWVGACLIADTSKLGLEYQVTQGEIQGTNVQSARP